MTGLHIAGCQVRAGCYLEGAVQLRVTVAMDDEPEGGQPYKEPSGEAEEVQEVVDVSNAHHGSDQRELSIVNMKYSH